MKMTRVRLPNYISFPFGSYTCVNIFPARFDEITRNQQVDSCSLTGTTQNGFSKEMGSTASAHQVESTGM